ncbi:DUF4184 family protein [Flavobacterium fluviale]|uniref:DUF4184 domain-containing protein n=1 Tax=Flavobacterium fluviale TaxID=2249356 RepID=A0A344LMY3_9FLAO|nr:DUF4184 family protein [Flavobacterium fluviale]AXB55275.1 DUF4184 domain-containing protein [Flavobacterium fluviale]
MPFTFSHPAIILPLRYLPKKWFSLTALIIGSLTPDFEYFLRMKVKSVYSHTISGIFWFDLPLAILLIFIFHNITRDLLFHNLPAIIKDRILHFTDFNWNTYFRTNWLIVLLSALIGIISHIFWDGFTHNHGYFVNQIDILKNSISLFGSEIPFWKIAQHASSLTGAIIIIVTFIQLPQHFTPSNSGRRTYWSFVILFSFSVLFVRFLSNPKALHIGNLIVSIIASSLIAIIVIPLLFKFKSRIKN